MSQLFNNEREGEKDVTMVMATARAAQRRAARKRPSVELKEGVQSPGSL